MIIGAQKILFSRRGFILVFSFSVFLLLAGTLNIFAAPPATKYSAGETLDPDCAPGSTNCSVEASGGGMEIGGSITSATEGSVLFAGSSGVLTQDNTNFFWDDTNNRLGIKTNSPRVALEISGDGALLATGTFGSGWTEPNIGAGVRMVWYPRKAAFRAGRANDTEWDNASIGNYSFAGGYGNTASATYSVAFGTFSTASAIGSFVNGDSSTVSGEYSASFGYGNTVSGNNSFSAGTSTTSSGYASTSFGEATTGSGYTSFAIGESTEATGRGSSAFGYTTTANSYLSLALGRYNVGGGTGTSWVATDSIFEIGIGSSGVAKANALTVLKNGNVGIGISAPNFLLDVNGDSSILGKLSIYNNTNNTTVGYQAGNAVTTGLRNTFLGYQAGLALTTGDDNTVLGYNSVPLHTDLDYTVAVGNNILANGIDGVVRFGAFIGHSTGYNIEESTEDVAIGFEALKGAASATDTFYNVAIGAYSMFSSQTPIYNTAIGNSSLVDITTGQENTAIGAWSGDDVVDGIGNVAIGYGSTIGGTGSNYNIAIGHTSTATNTGGGDHNIAIGYGTYAGSSGSRNIVIGDDVDIISHTISNQLTIGNLIFGTSVDGINTTISTGNIGIGDPSPDYRFDVDGNVADFVSGFFNDGNATTQKGLIIQIGEDAPSGTSNIYVEFRDGDGTTQGSISSGGGGTGVAFNITSDARLKENISDTALSLEILKNIQVRDYSFISDPNHQTVHGFIAQELYNIYPNAVARPDNENDLWMVDYSKLMPLVIKSIQDLDIKLEPLTLLDTQNSNSLGGLIKIFLADAGNGLEKLFVKEIYTQKICVGNTCINETELNNLINKNSQTIIIQQQTTDQNQNSEENTEQQNLTNDNENSENIEENNDQNQDETINTSEQSVDN